MLISSIIEILLFPLSAWYVVVVQSLITADSVQTHGLQNSRLLCLSLSPGVCSNSCPLSCWFYPTISSNESALCIRWPKYWSFSFQRISRVDFLYVWLLWSPCCPRPPKSLLKHHSLKSINSLRSAFFMHQLSHPYMTTGKTRALTVQIFVGKVMSLLFNTQSRFLIAFLPTVSIF